MTNYKVTGSAYLAEMALSEDAATMLRSQGFTVEAVPEKLDRKVSVYASGSLEHFFHVKETSPNRELRIEAGSKWGDTLNGLYVDRGGVVALRDALNEWLGEDKPAIDTAKLEQRVRELMAEGRKIQAIKEYRQAYADAGLSASLLDAKNAVERIGAAPAVANRLDAEPPRTAHYTDSDGDEWSYRTAYGWNYGDSDKDWGYSWSEVNEDFSGCFPFKLV